MRIVSFLALLALAACGDADDKDTTDSPGDSDTEDTDTQDTDTQDTDTEDTDTQDTATEDTDTEDTDISETGDTGLTTGGPQCVDDPNEPNDNESEALPLPSPATGLIVTDTSPDFFLIDIPPGELLSIDTTWAEVGADIDLALWDLSGGVLQTAGSTDASESMVYENATANVQTVALETILYSSANGCVEYSVATSFAPPPACQDDVYEFNDTLATALPLPAASETLAVTDISNDFFLVDVPPGELLTIEVVWPEPTADLDLNLFDLTGNVLDSTASVSQPEYLHYENTSANTQTVVMETVFFSSPGGCAEYTVSTSTTPILACAEDTYEDNDDIATALPLPPQGETLAVLDTDRDFWSASLNPGDELVFNARPIDPQFDYPTVFPTLTDGTPVGPGVPWYSVMSITNETLAPMDIVIDTYTFDSCVLYTMDSQINVGVVPTCGIDDIYEENDTAATAYVTGAGTLTALSDNFDYDYYQVDVPDGSTLDVTLDIVGTHDLDLFLTDATGASLSSSTQWDPYEQASYSNNTGATQTVTIEIEPWSYDGDTCASYDLIIEL